METKMNYMNDDLNLKATELRLGLPGSDDSEKQWASTVSIRNKKRSSSETSEESKSKSSSGLTEAGNEDHHDSAPPSKAQVLGWPPIRSYRRNCLESKKKDVEGTGKYVKVSVDGAPYLRKIDLKVYKTYPELLKALEHMFKLTIGAYSEMEFGYNGSNYAPTYEDKDGDWMLVGDVPWEMFISSCKRLRIMKGSEVRGLGCGSV